MLKTEKEIIQALCRLNPNLPVGIQALAEKRGMDVDNLTNYQYYMLIKLEAEFSVSEKYHDKLIELANNIDTEN
jgi:hypothetical protein